LGVPCHIAARDLSDVEQATDWVAAAEEALGPIDVLVNNAGVQHVGPTEEMDCEGGEGLLAVNLLSPLRLIRHLLPKMLERKAGTIVNIASMAALAPTAGMTYYNSSKGGLAAASEAMHGEVRSQGVHVITVYPGIIFTPMGTAGYARYEETLGMKLQPRGTTTELARLIRRAELRRKARVVYPRVYLLTRWFPALTRVVMDRFTPKLKEH
ncbi:MAG: SDR family oxidoreductase, partial [Myxococcales bacterium]|nr:SDR family oxidoreductase [Myxococcales bacterium]